MGLIRGIMGQSWMEIIFLLCVHYVVSKQFYYHFCQYIICVMLVTALVCTGLSLLSLEPRPEYPYLLRSSKYISISSNCMRLQ